MILILCGFCVFYYKTFQVESYLAPYSRDFLSSPVQHCDHLV